MIKEMRMKIICRALAALAIGIALILTLACPPPGPDPVNSSTPTSTPAPLTDAQAVAAAKSALAIGYQAGDSASSVTGNLTLATVGSNSVSISWATGDSAHVSVAGTVTRPAFGQANASLTLTATLSKGTVTDTKTFPITVIASLPTSFTVAHDWTNFGGVIGSYPAYMAIQDLDHVCVATMGRGMVYSDDGGTTWNMKITSNSNIASNSVYDVAMSGNLVFIATFNGLSIWDRTASAPDITNFLNGYQVYTVIADGGNLYLATSDGVYHGSASTTPDLVRAGTTFHYPESIFLSGGHLYAAGDSDATHVEPINVFDTSNWSAAPTAIDVNDSDDFAVGPIWAAGNAICLGINNSPWYSADSGAHFNYAQPVEGGGVTGIIPFGSALLSVRYGGDIWLSVDSGANWVNYAVTGYGSGVAANGVSYDGSEILIAHNGGVIVGTLN
jgi:hypothetical protein